MADSKCFLSYGGAISLIPISPLSTLYSSFCSVRHTVCTVLCLSALSSPNIWKTLGEAGRNSVAGVNEPDPPLSSSVAVGTVLVFLGLRLPCMLIGGWIRGPVAPYQVTNPRVCDSHFSHHFAQPRLWTPLVLNHYLASRTLAPLFVQSFPILHFNGLFKPKYASETERKSGRLPTLQNRPLGQIHNHWAFPRTSNPPCKADK